MAIHAVVSVDIAAIPPNGPIEFPASRLGPRSCGPTSTRDGMLARSCPAAASLPSLKTRPLHRQYNIRGCARLLPAFEPCHCSRPIDRRSASRSSRAARRCASSIKAIEPRAGNPFLITGVSIHPEQLFSRRSYRLANPMSIQMAFDFDLVVLWQSGSPYQHLMTV